MSTRSGKAYNEPKRSKKRTTVKDTTFDGTSPEDTGADHMDTSSLSTRDLRSRRSSVKDSTFDKSNSSMTKNDIESATDSNWIISDLSNKVKRRKSNLNIHLNGSLNSVINGHVEKESEEDSDGAISKKRLRKRKTSIANNTLDKNDKVDEKDTNETFEKDETAAGPVNNKKKGNNKTLITNEINIEKDTEADKTLQKDETVTVSGNNKKKGKKNKTQVMSENNTEKETETFEKDKTFEKDETATVSVDKKKKKKTKTPVMSEINIEKDTEKDKTLEKDETATDSIDKKKKHKNKTRVMNENNIEKDTETNETATTVNKKNVKNKTLVISDINIERDTENDLNSPNVAGQQIKKKKKKVKGGKKKKQKGKAMEDGGDTALNKADNVLDTTFDKEKETKDISTEKVDSEINENNVQKELILNSSIASKKNLRSNKSSIKDTTFEKEDKMETKDISIEKVDSEIIENNVRKELVLNSSIASKKNLRSNKSSIKDTTFEKEDKMETKDISIEKVDSEIIENNVQKELVLNSSIASKKNLRSNKSNTKSTTFEKEDKIVDTTFEKNENNDKTFDNKESNSTDSSKVNVTFDKNDKNNDTFEKDASTSFDTFKKGAKTRKSSINEVFNTSNHSSPKVDVKKQNTLTNSAIKTRKSLTRQNTEINIASPKKLDSTFDKISNIETSQSVPDASTSKLNTTFDKEVSKSSLISSDNSISRISITSDESAENIMNTTPVLVESSLDVSQVKESPKEAPKTPLKREGTFTKDTSEVQVQSPRTPGRSRPSLTPAAGCTPYHIGKSSQKKPMLNITRSVEKRLSVEAPTRLTRVMFCSPVDNPAIAGQEKRKVIKSNLKGSNKSFVFDESASISRAGRKRSYTQSDADDARAKRSRLAEDLQQSVDRLSRPRTASTTVKPAETTPKKASIPFKSKSETKPARTRLPNFAALHQRRFDKMESLGECQERKAKRARQMLTPTGSKNMLERISPTNTTDSQKQTTKEPPKPKDKTDTPTKKLPTLESLRPGFTRFGFKMNLDINPFSVPPKNDKPREKPNGFLQRPGILPSVAGATSGRREVAKQAVMREKSFVSKRKLNRSENRTIIKGVRTNRRFELQMKLRNVE